jgi:alpha-L-rhamnosidase
MNKELKQRTSQLILILAGILAASAVLNAANVKELRSEYRTNPLGMDARFPRLSWVIESVRRGEKQTAYQVVVASTPERLAQGKGDLWDSGKVASDRQNQLEYAGKPLGSRMSCYWKVRIWDRDGRASAWSHPASWTMGLLHPGDWKAEWIGVNQTAAASASAPGVLAHGKLRIDNDVHCESATNWAKPRYLRKSFTLDRTVHRATVYATALGLYELRLNGQRVGNHFLAPEWTDYHKHVQYQTYDVTSMVRNGPNALAAILGNGWYSGGWQHWTPKLEVNYGTEPFLLAQLEIEFTDGSRQMIVSDDSWRGTTNGPLQFSGIYEGVTYDARLEMPGWDTPGFNDAKWSTVTTYQAGDDLKAGRLVWQRSEPIRATQELKPVAITEPKPGVYVFAFAQNMVGWCRLKVHGKVGETVELQHGEMRNPDGTVFTGNLCVVSKHRAQSDRYTFRSNGMETFEPRFTYHGFQYVEVRGLKEKPRLDSLTGVVFHSACPEVGQFACSNPLLNRLALNILWSQRGNYMGIPTDCPQRNERCGYTGDAEFFMRAAVYNMDVSSFFNKWLVDVCEDSQLPGGWFADHAPFFCPAGGGPNIGWTDGGIICPYEIYRTYGDTRVIRDHYAAMKRNLEWLAKESTDFLFTGRVGNGDWLSNGGGAGKEVIGTAYSAFDFHLMAEMADAIGEGKDAVEFRDRAGKIAAAFAHAYLDAEGHIRDSSQSGYALAFTMGLVPASLKEKMIERFADEVRRFDWHPRTGFIGTPRLLPGLHLAGRDDDAYKLLLTRTAPSWLYPVSIGATTIWEQWVAWDGKTPQGGMNSLNHYSFGSVGEYLYGMVGGIQPAAPGYKQIHVQPVIRDGLTWAKTSYDSICGKIATSWKVEADKLELDVTIPANTAATVYVPARDAKTVTESGRPAAQSDGVRFLRMERDAAVYEVGSGTYEFEAHR